MADPIHPEMRRAHRALIAWQNKHGWTPLESHKALVASNRYSGDFDQFNRFARAARPLIIVGAKTIIEFCRRNPEPSTFKDWMTAQGGPPKNRNVIEARRAEQERQRDEHQRQWLARERRGCGRGDAPADEFDGLDAGAIAALSGGTISRGVVRYG